MSDITSAARANLILAPTGLLLAILSSTLIARWLGPEIYADYATLTSILAWSILLADGGCNVGLGRYLQETRELDAQGTLYNSLQKRRWIIVSFYALVLMVAGPLWANYAQLPAERWGTTTFLLLSLLCAATLHGQLANTALVSAFYHRKALLLSQIMMIVRALVLLVLAGLLRNPINLIIALIFLASIESFIMHRFAAKVYGASRAPLPKGLVFTAQKHGMVSQFDKLTTALSSGSFLLIVLAASQSRTDLAMLAVATDLLQKLLSVVGLPLSNLVLPILNDSRADPERHTRHVTRFAGLSVLLFATSCGAALTAMPTVIPLLLGEAYTPAIPLAYIWIVPLFIEAGARMVWGSALLSLDQRGWLMRYNSLFGFLSVTLLLLCYQLPLSVLLLILGGLRVFMTILLLLKAHKLGLFSPEARPWSLIVLSAIAFGLAYLAQHFLGDKHSVILLLSGLSVYGAVIIFGLHFLPLIPRTTRDALCLMAGKYEPIVSWLIPQAASKDRNGFSSP